MSAPPQKQPAPPGDEPGNWSLKHFLENTLPSKRRQKLHSKYPELMEQILSGELDDRAAASRMIKGDDALVWILHMVLHTNFMVRVLTWRCRSFCGRPCHPASLKDLPCDWSEQVLWHYFIALSPMSDSRSLLQDFLKYAPEEQGLVDWLVYKLHYNYHYQHLRQAGFIPPEPSRMPRAIRDLAERDPNYRTLWVHRWYWGNTSLDAVASVIGLRVTDPVLRRMVDEVDSAFLASREIKSLASKYKALHQVRRESGIPPRFDDPR